MKLARTLPLLALLFGVVLLAVGLACGGDEKPKTQAVTTQPPATETPTVTATITPTATPTAIPTPTPYNGSIARFKFPRLNIDAPIEELAINARDELDTPKAENKNVGWYYIYDKPGRANPDNLGWTSFGGQPGIPAKGNAIFSAHVYYRNVPAPFVSLAKDKVGDEVIVVMDNGKEYKYQIIANNRYNRDLIDMGQVIWPKNKPADKEWITMITCGGALDQTGQEYVDRDVVIAELMQ